jgi:ABC-type transporter Mla subunit MlaD
MSDKTLGYLSFIVIVVLIVGTGLLMWKNEREAGHFIQVRFSDMGSLQPEDAVTIRGFKVGRITRVERDGESALVTAMLFEPMVFRADTKFSNISPDIMGDRELRIVPGEEGATVRQGHVFEGEFEPGLAEVLRLVDFVEEQVAFIMDVARIVQFGDSTRAPLQGQIQNVLSTAENALDTLTRLVATVDKSANRALRQVQNYSGSALHAVAVLDTTLDTLRQAASDGIVQTRAVMQRADTLVSSLGLAVKSVDEHPLVNELLRSRDIMDGLDSLVATLNSVVGSIDRQGIVMLDSAGNRISMVRLGNLHLFRERAASKAKKRQQNP